VAGVQFPAASIAVQWELYDAGGQANASQAPGNRYQDFMRVMVGRHGDRPPLTSRITYRTSARPWPNMGVNLSLADGHVEYSRALHLFSFYWNKNVIPYVFQ